jgi:hypothetical protein
MQYAEFLSREMPGGPFLPFASFLKKEGGEITKDIDADDVEQLLAALAPAHSIPAFSQDFGDDVRGLREATPRFANAADILTNEDAIRGQSTVSLVCSLKA